MSRSVKVLLRARVLSSFTALLAASALGQTNDSLHVASGSTISAFAVEPDGKIIVGGSFGIFGGQACNHLGRLNPDGSLDLSFNPGDSNSVTAVAVQPDGKLIAARDSRSLPFTSTNVLRYNPDGSLDPAFHGLAAGDNVECLALQRDGKILLGGLFKTLGGQTRTCLARLNTDGTLDATFNVFISETSGLSETSPEVASIALQPDGGILIGGTFTAVAGGARTNICRLNPDGSLDNSFVSSLNPLSVQCLALQPDGKVLAGFSAPGAAFMPYLGTNYLRRFNTDGTFDSLFVPGFNSQVTSLSLQADGKIMLSGMFTRCEGSSRTNVARLYADGTLDTSFTAHVSYPGGGGLSGATADFILAMQSDGQFLLGVNAGRTFPGTNYVARFLNTDPAADSLASDGASINWSRDVTAPEVWRATFDACTNGADWSNLGDGTRISGGWQLTGLALPPDTPIRARGLLTGGANNGSSWFVETTLNLTQPPRILADSVFGVRSNQFSFDIAAIPDQLVLIQASTNLQDWTPLSTNTAYSNPLRFTDSSPASLPSRFYRVRLQ